MVGCLSIILINEWLVGVNFTNGLHADSTMLLVDWINFINHIMVA